MSTKPLRKPILLLGVAPGLEFPQRDAVADDHGGDNQKGSLQEVLGPQHVAEGLDENGGWGANTGGFILR